MIGDQLYPTIATYHPTLAARITGMLLELDNDERMTVLGSDAQLGHAVNAAVRMLEPGAGEKQVRAQHGLAHPPTWAHHL
eukprot:4528892-Lingulodinium_polyedra.AAC.1